MNILRPFYAPGSTTCAGSMSTRLKSNRLQPIRLQSSRLLTKSSTAKTRRLIKIEFLFEFSLILRNMQCIQIAFRETALL